MNLKKKPKTKNLTTRIKIAKLVRKIQTTTTS